MIFLKNEKEIMLLKESGRILRFILNSLEKKAKKGTNLLELEELAQKLCKEYKVVPIFLGYQPEGAKKPFPAAICTSLNDVVVHGVPRDYFLKDGDVLKIDMGIAYQGMITDAALTVLIGKISPLAKKLVEATKKSLEAAIKVAKKGRSLGDIGWAIENQAKKYGFSVLKSLTGHGVGFQLHEDPVIFNYGKKGEGEKLREGMVLAIEPMLSVSCQEVVQKEDESYATLDESLAAHFEHTIAITSKGTIVLTE